MKTPGIILLQFTFVSLLAFSSLLVCGTFRETLAAESATPVTEGPIQPVNVSISPFPYDLTAIAVQTVNTIIKQNANVYTVQLDNGIPWEEALDDKPFDSEIMAKWEGYKSSVASNHQQVYLAIAPLAEDRISCAPGFNGATAPSWATDEKHTTDQLKRAYTKYVLRALDYFRPTYLNLGVEAGDMAAKKPEKWSLFEELFTYCTAEIRKKHSSVQLGISFGLPLLMRSGVLKRVEKVVTLSDYVGISFYPYMSEFYRKLGASPLPDPPDQWRQPLDWLARNVNKPLAVCETGYSSTPVTLRRYGLNLSGSDDLQSAYVADLATFARRDHYLFVVFFLAVDCDALIEKLPSENETAKLWEHTGFFHKNLKEKPAWASYQRAWLGRESSPASFPSD
jgi:hypothetical protein